MKIVRLLQGVFMFLMLFWSHPSIANDYRVIDWEDLFQKNQPVFSQENLTQKSVNDYVKKRHQLAPNKSLSGQKITISGFVVPLEYDDNSRVIELLLVPYYGACIHVPPPPKNQIIHVHLIEPLHNLKTMDMITVSGRLTLDGQVSVYGESDYTLMAEHVVSDQSVDYFQTILAIALMLMCGLTLCLGWLIGKLMRAKNIHLMGVLLSISAGTMVYLSFANVWLHLNGLSIGLLALGYATMWLLSCVLSRKENLTSIALIFHNVPEIFIVFSTAFMNIWLGILITLLVSVHNVSLGFSLAQTPEKEGVQRKFIHSFGVSFSPILIVLIIYWVMRNNLSMDFLIHFSLFSGGMLAYIAVTEVLPLARNYINARCVALSLVSSCLLMFFLTQLL